MDGYIGDEMDTERIRLQCLRLEGWLKENAPEVVEQQKHLDEGTEAQAYWHLGRLVALRDVLKNETN